jgi:hypothetical protein
MIYRRPKRNWIAKRRRHGVLRRLLQRSGFEAQQMHRLRRRVQQRSKPCVRLKQLVWRLRRQRSSSDRQLNWYDRVTCAHGDNVVM